MESLVKQISAIVADSRGKEPDAVASEIVAAVGLRMEWGALDHEDGGCLYDTREEVRLGKYETLKTRYITDWVAAEE